jgi:hypothetical protein
MAIIFSLLGFILAAVFLLYAERLFGIVYFRDHRLITLLMASFFTGLIIFTLFTGNIRLMEQRVTLIIVSLLMIYANLFLSKKRDEAEKNGKEKGKRK